MLVVVMMMVIVVVIVAGHGNLPDVIIRAKRMIQYRPPNERCRESTGLDARFRGHDNRANMAVWRKPS
jgi:hypothetical protein